MTVASQNTWRLSVTQLVAENVGMSHEGRAGKLQIARAEWEPLHHGPQKTGSKLWRKRDQFSGCSSGKRLKKLDGACRRKRVFIHCTSACDKGWSLFGRSSFQCAQIPIWRFVAPGFAFQLLRTKYAAWISTNITTDRSARCAGSQMPRRPFKVNLLRVGRRRSSAKISADTAASWSSQ